MLIDDKISYTAVNEAYCLLTAWMREERIAANYNREEIAECVKFLAEILKHPENFQGVDRKPRNLDSNPVKE